MEADLKQCECEITYQNPFSIGGNSTEQKRCHKKTRWIVRDGKEEKEPNIKRAHFTDVGQCDGAGTGATYECKRCGWKSGWLFGLTKTEIKRGVECPKCNGEQK